MRHIEVRDLWLQQEVRSGNVLAEWVEGDANPADLTTKYLTKKEVKYRLALMSVDWRDSSGQCAKGISWADQDDDSPP